MESKVSFVAKRGCCTSIWQFCGLISVPWELSSQSLAGLALDLKLVMLRVLGCQIINTLTLAHLLGK